MTDAGWYSDPSGKTDVFRWWDGSSWTTWLNSDPQAPPPPPQGEPATATSDLTPHIVKTRPAMAVGIGILVLVLGIGALIGVAVLQDRETVTGSPVAPPPPLPSKSVDPNAPTYDEDTREADVGGFGATMPGDPFFDSMAEEFPGVATPARLSQALVHPNFDGQTDWYASCGIGIVDESLVVEGDIEKTGRNMWKALKKEWFSGTPLKERDLKEVHPPNKGTDVFTIQGDLHYKLKGLPSTYDRMSLMLVDLGDGRFAAWFGSRPDDAKKNLMDQYQYSLDSIKKTR